MKTRVIGENMSMESGDHPKNETNPKRKTSMVNILVMFLILIICSISLDAQQITPTIARKLVRFSNINVQTNAFFIQELRKIVEINSISDIDRTFDNLPNRIDIAEELIYRFYRVVGSGSFYSALGNYFTPAEKTTMENFCEKYHLRVREIEQQEAEKQRLKQNELDYQTAIESANRNFEQKRYAQAVQDYRRALELKPVNANSINPKIREIERLLQQERELEAQYQNAIERAQKEFEQRRYMDAKTTYRFALEYKPENATFVNSKVAEIDKMLQFLDERKSKIYDYADDFASDYQTMNDAIKTNIKDILLGEKTTNSAKITITSVIDTTGVTSTSFVSTVRDSKLEGKLKQIANQVKLKQPSMNGYTVSAKAVFEYSASADEAIIKVKKDASTIYSNDYKYNAYRSEIGNTLSSAPMGKFTLQYNKITINGNDEIQDKLLKYNGTGGPSNAFKSLIVPGMGKRSVSGGKKSGIGTAIITYGLIGAGIGCKFIANDEYTKYHAASEQSAMDDHYKKANTFNQAFYVCVGAGAIIWIYDIIWVCRKGVQNKKEQTAWKRTNMSFYYNSAWDAKGLAYTINF